MIGQTKKQLFKLILYPAFFATFFISLPLFFLFKLHLSLINTLFIFYTPLFLAIYILLRIYLNKKSVLEIDIQKLQEKINIIRDEIQKKNNQVLSLNLRIERYNRLKSLIETINRQFEPEVVAKSILESISNLIAHGKGNCILYLVDIHNQKLNLCATKKEDPHMVIKAKEGDIFDYWVLRHTSSLLVEDVRKDFRFDLDKIKNEYSRPIQSLISAALLSQEKVLGIVRLDSPHAFIYTQDDLRFLNTISDLAAVAIENAKLFKETRELAIKDSLTSCYTRVYFLERLKEEFKRSLRKVSPLSLLMLDIDYFKVYNDKFGHIAGDIVLREISQLLREFSESRNGLVCRFGGEEFCILFANIDKKETLGQAEKLRQMIQEKEIVLRKNRTSITVSIGVASYPKDASLEEELIQKSDAAMYKAKEKGRNRVCGL